MQVRLSLGEKFINWFPHNTKLYIRGAQGKGWDVVSKLYTELHKQLNEFLYKLVENEIQYRRKHDSWCLRRDEDCHWYHIPRSKEERFEELLREAGSSSNWIQFEQEFDQYRIGGGYQDIDCYPPKE